MEREGAAARGRGSDLVGPRMRSPGAHHANLGTRKLVLAVPVRVVARFGLRYQLEHVFQPARTTRSRAHAKTTFSD